jgi:polar amino acid transport system substrate-binding protein
MNARRSALTLLLSIVAMAVAGCGRDAPATVAATGTVKAGEAVNVSPDATGGQDRLARIRAAGVLRVAAFDGNPPFGFVDPQTRRIAGLDVDVAQALADRLQVKLEVVPTNPANRVPLLLTGKVDLVLANFTITPERAKQIDFSLPYFASGTQFLARKGVLSSPQQLAGLRIGVDKGTVNEIVLREQYPQATLVAYDDTPFAFTALRNGNVQAISQDGPKLVGLLANVPDRQDYEIPAFSISDDRIGVGIPKGEAALKAFVDESLLALEASGKAQAIHDTWFGPASKTPLPRLRRIGGAD